MVKSTTYKLLTFYKFVNIENPQEEVKKHKQFCQDIGMKGRIFIGEEGINATATCNIGQYWAYKMFLNQNHYFNDIPDIELKMMDVDSHQFEKMIVRYRREIVALGKIYPSEEISKIQNKISADKFKEILEKNPDKYAILDMRNNYEYELGHFKNAVPAGTLTFKEVTDMIDNYKEKFDNKEVIMYCTGGIRCEKLSAMFHEKGLDNVYQLEGGVVKYVNQFNDGNWLGNLYTFDGRVSTKVGTGDTHTVISKCYYSGQPAETFYNCRYGPCNAQIIANPKQYRKHLGLCSEACYLGAYSDLYIKNEKWDPMDYKMLRAEIKKDASKKDEITKQVQSHLRKWLAKVEFNHKTPVVENRLIQD